MMLLVGQEDMEYVRRKKRTAIVVCGSGEDSTVIATLCVRSGTDAGYVEYGNWGT